VGRHRSIDDDVTVETVTVDVPCVRCQSYMLTAMQATDPTVLGLVVEHEGLDDGFVAYITYAGRTLARPQRVHRCILPVEDAAGLYRQIHEGGPMLGFTFRLPAD
jgi:hypothetical protein